MDSLVDDARTLFDAAVRAVRADALLGGFDWEGATDRGLGRYRSVRLMAAGKAALAMASEAARALAQHGVSPTQGLAVVPTGYAGTRPAHVPAPPAWVDVAEGGHPAPTTASVEAARRVLALAEASEARDLLVALISGGGTALIGAPAAGLSLADVQETFGALLESGAGIHAMNAVRKHLTRLGGGQLARAVAPAQTLALLVSDVPGDEASVIASGPTVPDPTTFADACAVLRERVGWARVPEAVRRRLQRGADGALPETPKPGATLFDRVKTHLVGTNADALAAMQRAASTHGYEAFRDGRPLEGEARNVGRRLAREALQAAGEGHAGKHCILRGGETTVTVRGEGTGGRNQELALAAALELDGAEADVALLSAGTDGIDGPTDAAGAIVTPRTASVIRAAGLDPAAHLARNDAYPALDAAGALLRTGPTHTNVMDVSAVLVA